VAAIPKSNTHSISADTRPVSSRGPSAFLASSELEAALGVASSGVDFCRESGFEPQAIEESYHTSWDLGLFGAGGGEALGPADDALLAACAGIGRRSALC
jgi:hypothetical protein